MLRMILKYYVVFCMLCVVAAAKVQTMLNTVVLSLENVAQV